MGPDVLPGSRTLTALVTMARQRDCRVSRHGRSRNCFSSTLAKSSLFSNFLLFYLISCRFFRQSLAANPPECRRGVFFQVTQHNRQGMEKAVPNFSERQGDGGRALLMTPEPNKETFPALECPQGEERRAAFLQDAKKPLENPALSGTSVETETELEEDAFYAGDDLATMSREGKGPSSTELHSLQEDPDFFSSLSRQEPDIALEAHDVAGKSPVGAIGVASWGTGTSPGPSCVVGDARVDSVGLLDGRAIILEWFAAGVCSLGNSQHLTVKWEPQYGEKHVDLMEGETRVQMPGWHPCALVPPSGFSTTDRHKTWRWVKPVAFWRPFISPDVTLGP